MKKLPPHFQAECEKFGAQIIEYAMGGVHPYVRVQLGTQTRRVIFGGTPSDRRAMLNNRSNLRRILRDMQEQDKKAKSAA